MNKKSVWVFCATASGHSYATVVAIESLMATNSNIRFNLCLSAQSEADMDVLKRHFPLADVFEPNVEIPSELKRHPRVRSLIHSRILNEGWARRSKSDYRIIIDNDVFFSRNFSLNRALEYMESRNAVLFGTEYPRVHMLRQVFRGQKAKPQNVPNCIFCVMKSSYYDDEESICEFDYYARNCDDPSYSKDDGILQGCQIDTGAKIYLKPVREGAAYISIPCFNRWHPYSYGRLVDRVLGSDISPELYRLKNFGIIMHHFKKLSIISTVERAKKEYFNWLKMVREL